MILKKFLISKVIENDFQVLLSQVHRLRALDLLGRFLDLGPWAVSLVCTIIPVFNVKLI